jgi:hypothetical protein
LEVITVVIKSFKDASYNAARAGDSIEDSARFIYEQCPTFLDNKPEEIMAEIIDGIMLRYSERHPAKVYLRVDNNLVLCKGKIPEKGEKLEVSVYSAFAMSQQQHGQLKNTDPALHSINGNLRTAFNKYKKNVITAIEKAIRNIIDPTEKTRATTQDFAVWIVSEFDTIKTRCKNAKARGDETADLALLDRQMKAFFSTK